MLLFHLLQEHSCLPFNGSGQLRIHCLVETMGPRLREHGFSRRAILVAVGGTAIVMDGSWVLAPRRWDSLVQRRRRSRSGSTAGNPDSSQGIARQAWYAPERRLVGSTSTLSQPTEEGAAQQQTSEDQRYGHRQRSRANGRIALRHVHRRLYRTQVATTLACSSQAVPVLCAGASTAAIIPVPSTHGTRTRL